MRCYLRIRERKRRGEVPLSEAEEGQRYTVTSLQERDPRLLLFLHQAGIGPGESLRVMSQNYDQTVSIELSTGNLASLAAQLRKQLARIQKQGMTAGLQKRKFNISEYINYD